MTGLSPVTSANGTAPTNTTAAAEKKAQVDYDAFLRLLVAELENQDPTKPMDSSEFVAQLATFSNVEQGIATNKRLDALLAAQSLGQAGTLIGRTVSGEGASGTVTRLDIAGGNATLVLSDGNTMPLADVTSVS